ncbi:MAG: peptidoglycan DD-metalloendopeptidase family protein [Pseudomonadota bacterium]
MLATKTNRSVGLFAGISLLAAVAVSNAQPVGTEDSDSGAAIDQQIQQIETTVGSNERKLQDILRERGLADAQINELRAEIDQIQKDRASITAALIAAAKAEQKLAGEILELGIELEDLETREDALTASLWERRALLAEVLAGLQRMGLNPPPAILVQPEDALASVRSSILLASVVPEMRQQTAILVDDLRELAGLRTTIAEETQRLSETRAAQAAEQGRLELLVAEKRQLEAERETSLQAQQLRADELAAEAQSLESLISNLEAEVAAIREEAERRRREAEERARREEEERLAALRAAEAARLAALRREEAERQAALEAAETARREAQEALETARRRAAALAAVPQVMAPGTPFADLRNSLPKPVIGETILSFGEDDGLGARAQGDTIETVANTIVTAPAEGTVLYAGPFRAYGNLLILDAGDEYHIVLAGMDRIDVAQGQFVVAGEPVGVMGSIRLASVSAQAATGDKPTLYVEFRKNGKPIDTALWWGR